MKHEPVHSSVDCVPLQPVLLCRTSSRLTCRALISDTVRNYTVQRKLSVSRISKLEDTRAYTKHTGLFEEDMGTVSFHQHAPKSTA